MHRVYDPGLLAGDLIVDLAHHQLDQIRPCSLAGRVVHLELGGPHARPEARPDPPSAQKGGGGRERQ